MNYGKIYNALIERARYRTLEDSVYIERHHVVPKCMGGTNESANIVRLTPEEHFVAHQLLVKMYPDHPSLIWALARMMGDTQQVKRNNHWYGWIRRRFSEHMKQPKSAETRKKMSDYWTAYRKANPVTPERREQMRLHRTGTKLSDETKLKMRNSRLGAKHTEESKALMSQQRKGKPKRSWTESEKEVARERMKQYWASRKTQNQGDE